MRGRTMPQPTVKSVRIAINGFGRIGRAILRIVLAGRSDVELVVITEIEPLETCAYLFEYDSIYGTWPGEVATEPGALIVAGRRVPFPVSYTHLRAHETDSYLVCRLLLEKKK